MDTDHPTFDRETFHLLVPSGRLRLRPLRLSDADNLRQRCADPQNVQFLPHLQGKENQTVQEVEQWIQTVINGFNKDSLFLVVEDTTTNTVIGEGLLGYIDWKTKIGDSGIMIDHQQTGKGYATEAIQTSLDFAFTTLDLVAVNFGTLQANKAMTKVLQHKLPVKIKPQERIRKDGLPEYIFNFTKADWLAAKKTAE